MKSVTATEFKARCLSLLDEVRHTGEELLISKRGKPVAKVVPETGEKPWLALRGTGAFAGDPFAPVVEEADVESLK